MLRLCILSRQAWTFHIFPNQVFLVQSLCLVPSPSIIIQNSNQSTSAVNIMASITEFFISGLHRYECVAPLVANSLQSGRFWARSTASVHDSPRESRSFCTVFIQVIRGRPGGLFRYTEGEEVKICFASTLTSIRPICPNRVRSRAWIIYVSRGWLVWRRTSSLEMKWYQLMPRSIRISTVE